jgi:hypothetical protein
MPSAKLWKAIMALKVIFNRQMLEHKGQGEGDTKWKGWAWNLLLVKFVKSLDIY